MKANNIQEHMLEMMEKYRTEMNDGLYKKMWDEIQKLQKQVCEKEKVDLEIAYVVFHQPVRMFKTVENGKKKKLGKVYKVGFKILKLKDVSLNKQSFFYDILVNENNAIQVCIYDNRFKKLSLLLYEIMSNVMTRNIILTTQDESIEVKNDVLLIT
jgi:hypothetical protein